jgi:hypothetical protein
MFDRTSVKADGPGVYHSARCGQSLRELFGRDELLLIRTSFSYSSSSSDGHISRTDVANRGAIAKI